MFAYWLYKSCVATSFKYENVYTTVLTISQYHSRFSRIIKKIIQTSTKYFKQIKLSSQNSNLFAVFNVKIAFFAAKFSNNFRLSVSCLEK